MPIPVDIKGVIQVSDGLFETALVTIPGIGAAIAYTAGDAFGGKFILDVPVKGQIHTALFLDRDDEGLETDLVMFRDDFTATVDNDAFAVSDADLQKLLGNITWAAFKNFTNNQESTAAALGLLYHAPKGQIFCQCVARGAPNIAAGSEPMVRLSIIPVREE